MTRAATSSHLPALILFAHGARDARWAEPFERLAALLDGDKAVVRLAYLELMQPDLAGAVGELAQAGHRRITIVPVFFGQGGHLRRDLPLLVEQVRRAHPDVAISTAPAVGEDEGVLRAIAAFCVAQLNQSADAASAPEPGG